MIVLKFGGSSVKQSDRIRSVISILKMLHETGESFTCVFSAMGGVTDSIIKMSDKAAAGDAQYFKHLDEFKTRHLNVIEELLEGDLKEKVIPAIQQSFVEMGNLLQGVFLVKDLTKRTQDYLLSFGERNSSYIITHALKQNGVPAEYLDARKVIRTDGAFGNAKVDFKATNTLINNHYSSSQNHQIVTGFIGSSDGENTTTLGRGGSDYTAAILASALDAKEIQIWTDVDGVMTADPRIAKKAFSIKSMTYSEAMEMSHFGAKVIYPPTIQPALRKKIPLYIKNTFNPEFPGTLISDTPHAEDAPIKGISSISDIVLLTLEGSGMVGAKGIAARLFNSLAHGGINIIMITQGSSEYSITFAVSPSDSESAKSLVEKEFELEIKASYIKPLKVETELSIIAIIGENMKFQPGIAGKLFKSLGVNGINLVAIAQGSSELNISAVINKVNEAKAINAIHESFFLSDTKVLNLFMVGVGLIGGTLIKQIGIQCGFLAKNRGLEINVVGLANSKKMIFNENGIDLKNWKQELDSADQVMEIKKFVAKMRDMNLRNSVFLDNTANSDIPAHYGQILDSSISISTPNKVASSSPYENYAELKSLARKRGVGFMFETNVGAGLPVLSTLEDLISSGDNILKIEGILSGSLSFIFNNFGPDRSFSETVKEAQFAGYTEPDPRDDLSGSDVQRKLLILGRESGLPLEKSDLTINSILPQACIDANSVEEFYLELTKVDQSFETARKEAADKGLALRFIACLEGGKGEISLQQVDKENPFYNLSGSDNMIVFTTARYKERPLVIRGPGAGAEVTAAGVFAEIISIANRFYN